MGGDQLTLFLTFATTAAAAVMGAVATNGWRARILWLVALIFAISAFVYLDAQKQSPANAAIRILWGMSPFIGMAMLLIVTSGRTEKKLPPKPEASAPPIQLNPALTAAHFNDIVDSGTRLEAQRRLADYANQRAKLTGQVIDIRDSFGGLTVSVRGLRGDSHSDRFGMPMAFRRDQTDALAVIKPGDWIEFTGKVQHCNTYDWELVDCEFVGRAPPPPKPRAPRKRAAP